MASRRARSSGFHRYQHLQIYVSAMPALRSKWRPIGIISDAGGLAVRELKRIVSDETFDTIEGAEGRALELCKDWIDRHE